MVTTATPVTPARDLTAAPDRTTWRRSGWTDAALLAGITLVAAAMRLHGISARSFWFDEAVSPEIARLPWSQFIKVLWNREANMAFYYVLLHFWLSIGQTEGFIRGFSALFSVATVPVIHALGVRLFSRRAGLVAAWLLSINAYHVFYAQEARGYALVIFLSSLATLQLLKNLQEPASARWGAYTAISALAVYTQFFGGLVVVAHGVSLLFLKRDDVPWRDFLRSLTRFSFLMIPIAVFVVRVGPAPIAWIQKTRPDTVLNFLIDIGGNGGIWLLAFDAIALAAAGFWGAALWRAKGRTLQTWSFALVWAWLLVPILILLAASEWRPLFVPRYLSPSLPAFLLLISAGIARLRPAVLAWILGAIISVGSIAGTTIYPMNFDLGRDDWRSATSFIFDHAQPGDGVFFFVNFGRIPFEYYKSIRHPSPEWPKSLEATENAGVSDRDFQTKSLGELLTDARPAGDRVWLVMLYDTNRDGTPGFASIVCRAVFAKGRRLLEERHFAEVTVLLYSRDRQGASQISTAPQP